ncbi:glycosyltransferase family 2 protein [Sedimentitalea nanhaiensis]|uniref:Glycosyl transferase family 2 n=1 Tax=Sedimentitalea nanhaiensis TaxID=999627 RepID=A0A1I6ZKP8_9RHOB|nr:glycosyltransferase family 2 protein [Sedimentitalea nanhaiensis]SFT63249.1 Glycosyl transferase family 2 [Sedimentitalea nanhaiensis]
MPAALTPLPVSTRSEGPTARWGIVATVKAPIDQVLGFAAHHIELGAHRLYLYLDTPDPTTFGFLKAHPKVRVFTCDAAHWEKMGKQRPKKHQVRQCLNATHGYHRPPEVDWLAHIDVDEFLWPQAPLGTLLSALPPGCHCARVRPIEALDGTGAAFKGFIPAGPDRDTIVRRLYPEFGAFVKGGFLSHTAGKLFVRTGLSGITMRIHKVLQGERMNPGEQDLSQVELCHCHTRGWAHWIGAYRYRLEHGSYRAGLAPNRSPETGGLSLHDLLSNIEREQGEAGLRRIYDELCADTPDHRNRLRTEGLLRLHDLDLATKCRKQFPQFDPSGGNPATTA